MKSGRKGGMPLKCRGSSPGNKTRPASLDRGPERTSERVSGGKVSRPGHEPSCGRLYAAIRSHGTASASADPKPTHSDWRRTVVKTHDTTPSYNKWTGRWS